MSFIDVRVCNKILWEKRVIQSHKARSEVAQLLTRVRLFVTPWTVAYEAAPSLGFSRQEYWSGLPFPSPADLPNLGIEPVSPALQMDSLPTEPPGNPTVYALLGLPL